jgi:phospho-N-acetylmuramoyl-pentapeptide-transferase
MSSVSMMPLIAFFCGLSVMLIGGKPLIEWLRRKSWRKDQPGETWDVREDTPDTHRKKKGTPSMGGIGIIGSAVASYFALALTLGAMAYFSFPNIPRTGLTAHTFASFLLVPLAVTAFALLGFADDWSKASGRGGLRARAKLFTQIGLAVAFVVAWLMLTATQSFTGVRFVFFSVGDAFQSGITSLFLFAAICAFVIVATSNAVNLTDGIDGLAAGLAVQVGAAFLLARSYVAPVEVGLPSDLFWMALAGACLGFLFFNRFPARVFMGDTGSLAIGAALGIGAILSHAVFLLPFIAFIYFVEMFSVITQVLYFKWTKRKSGEGKRLFRRAPLHHHFELGGWSEWRVVLIFWFVNFFVGSIGLLLWHINWLPRWPG